ncbi:MAG: hypothetical protein KF802_09055 [Bdellovibrionaceae bacterium]|nr:hypothetical protein [Pseudobdellovibrionaceae bacterium]
MGKSLRFFQLLTTGLFTLTVALPANGQSLSPFASPAHPPKDNATVVTETASALAKGPTCDQNLLDELSVHIEGYRCLHYFDHGCFGIYALLNGALASSAALTNAGISLMEQNATKTIASAADELNRSKRLRRTNKQFNVKYKKFETAKAMRFQGKTLTSAQVQAITARTLEKLATDKTFAQARALRVATQKVVLAQMVRRGLFMGTMLTGGVGIGLFATSFIVDATPAGDACNDNGVAFIDYKPRENGKGCEPSFALDGLKVRSFFRQNDQKKLKILENDPSVCKYYNLLNEMLKGQLLTEMQILNQVKFNQMPSCQVGQRGVNYEIDLMEGKTFAVDSTMDPETQNLRRVWLGDAGETSGKGGLTVLYEDSADGSQPYRIETTSRAHVSVQKSFQEFLALAQTDKRYENAVKTLNASQFWTPMVASCCTEKEPDKCWQEKLPGLSEAMTEAKKQKKIQAVAPAADPVFNPESGRR